MKYVFVLGFSLLFGCSPQSPSPQTDLPQNTKEQQGPVPEIRRKLSSTPSNPVLIGIIGDWGTGSSGQMDVFQVLRKQIQQQRFQFIITVGDNFYPSGVTSVSDQKWQSVFQNSYGSLQTEIYPTLGNHDHRGNINAQIDYSKQHPYWTMPNRYYSVIQPLGDDVSALFLAIDTEPLWQEKDPAQLQWIEETLKASQAHWKIVFGHHPVYSSGPHGDNQTLIKTLEPILVRTKADVYIAGHDHALEINRPKADVLYVVSGGGGGKERAYPISPFRKNIYGKTGGGYVFMKLQADALEIQPVPMGESTPPSYILKKANTQQSAPAPQNGPQSNEQPSKHPSAPKPPTGKK